MPRTPFPPISVLRSLVTDDYALNGRRSGRFLKVAFDHLQKALTGATHKDIRQRLFSYPARRAAEGAKPATYRNELSVYRRALRLAVQAGLLDAVPPIPTVTVRNARQGFVDASAFSRIHAQLPAHVKGVAMFGYLTGWRKSEILGLRWSQVDAKACVIRIEQTKNDRPRTLPYGSLDELRKVIQSQSIAAAVWEAKLREPVTHVFSRYGKPVLWFDGAWKRACERAGVGKVLFHDLRRSAVRNFERAGVPRSVAMRVTGHVTESVYQRYAITCEQDIADGLERLAWLRDGARQAPVVRRPEAGRMVFAEAPITEAPLQSFDAEMVARPKVRRGLIDRGWKPGKDAK